jgi:hypothetical protein
MVVVVVGSKGEDGWEERSENGLTLFGKYISMARIPTSLGRSDSLKVLVVGTGMM